MNASFRHAVATTCSGLHAAGLALALSIALPAAAATPVDFGKAQPSAAARNVAEWVAHSRDNGAASFVIIDKRAATLYVFDAQANLRGSTAILLGSAPGDDTVPGIGDRPLAQVLPHEKTTPAGRFIAEHGRNMNGDDIVWVDYDAAVSMHRVRPTVAAERRLQRLASPTPDDNRISFGCINVPKVFYETRLSPAMASRQSVVYILPEQKTLREVFGPGVRELMAAERGDGAAVSVRKRAAKRAS